MLVRIRSDVVVPAVVAVALAVTACDSPRRAAGTAKPVTSVATYTPEAAVVVKDILAKYSPATLTGALPAGAAPSTTLATPAVYVWVIVDAQAHVERVAVTATAPSDNSAKNVDYFARRLHAFPDDASRPVYAAGGARFPAGVVAPHVTQVFWFQRPPAKGETVIPLIPERSTKEAVPTPAAS